MIFHSERLIFRRYTPDDLEYLMQMTSDPEVMKFIGRGTPWSPEETKRRLDGFINRYTTNEGLGLMAAIRRKNGEFIGHAGLVPQCLEGKPETEIGYWIARKHWGNGYAAESAKAWREFGFNTFHKTKLVSLIQYGNSGSVKVAEKTGLSFEKEIVRNMKAIALYSINKESGNLKALIDNRLA